MAAVEALAEQLQTSDPTEQEKPIFVALSAPLGPPHWDISDLEPLHEEVIALLGPYCAKSYKLDP